MNRRQILHALTAVVPLSGGCLSRTDQIGDSPTTEPSPTRAVTDGGRQLSIQSIETDTYVVRLNDLGTSPGGPIAEQSALDEREREVIEAATDGGYETDEVPDWLATFASRTPFVRVDGEYFQLEPTLPVYTVTAEPTTEDEVSGEIASNEAYREAVTHDGRRMTGLMRIARQDGFRTSYLWPSLREFLDAYDAVEYRGELLAFELRVDDPGPPYEITAEPPTLEEVARGSVWDATEASGELREAVREAGAYSGAYSLDDPPAGLLENLHAHEYVYLDGTFYTAYVENETVHDVSVHAEPVTGDGTLAVHLSLRNDADGPVEVMSGAPRPFGIVNCHPKGDQETTYLLWTDAYEENGHVHTEGREVVAVNDIGLLTEVGPGEEVSRTFELPADLPAGEYVVDHGLGIEYADREGGSFSFRVDFRVA